jgi:hypothetical protein
MPTSAIATFGAGRVDPLKDPRDGDIEVINLRPSTTFAAGTVLGEITATPGAYGAYASGNSDGTQNPTHILQYACVTDASGNITFGAGPAGTSEWGQTYRGAPAYRSGEFSCADLVGLDATALSNNRFGRLVQGTVSSGRVLIYGP